MHRLSAHFRQVPRSLVFAGVALLAGCATNVFEKASLDIPDQPVDPPTLSLPVSGESVTDAKDWTARAVPGLKQAFQYSVYGFFPDASKTKILSRSVIDDQAMDGRAVRELIEIRVSARFDGEDVDREAFQIDLLRPAGDTPYGVILLQSFCPLDHNHREPAVTHGGPGVSCNGGPLSFIMGQVFKRRISHPPVDAFLDRGFAIASIHSRDIIPDNPTAGLDALNELAPARAESDDRWGAIAAWAWIYSRMIDALEADQNFDSERIVALGHSRFGKSALLAAAFDSRIDAVIANQSGTGGAALTRDKEGESVAEITMRYPHWFATVYDNYVGYEHELPVDQHQLLAMIAPRPIFLGNARRDVWSDPAGTFRSARAASEVYDLLGVPGLEQNSPKDFNPAGNIAYWLRGGFHGLEEEDWPPILEFLDIHLPSPPSPLLGERGQG